MGQTVIEINGVKYDATTGSVINAQPAAQPIVHTPAPKHSGHNIDGIVSQAKPTAAHKLNPSFKPTIGRVVHDTSMVHHKHPTKSKTLMRTVVKKPGLSQHTQTNVATHSISGVKHTASYAASASHDSRLTKALSTPTHSGVARFNLTPSSKIQPSITHLPVQAQATHAHMPSTTPALSPLAQNHIKQGSTDFVNSQLAKQSNEDTASPFKKKRLHKRIASTFKGNRLKSIVTGSMAVLLLGGFIAFQNMPTISLVFANRTAGISAKIPNGIPSNFAINRTIDASKGQVTLAFASRTDERRFTITQQTTDLSPSELEEVLANSHNKNIQSYDSSGIKLFITGPGQADWVDGNMRYNVSGLSGLSSEQLATIARSM